jgi:hypothetical protein
MQQFWERELTDSEVEELLDRAASEVIRRKLQAPAILFLEMHKPLAYLGGHAALAFSPFIVPFIGFKAVDQWSQVAAKREYVERLIKKLEESAPAPEDPKEQSNPCSG